MSDSDQATALLRVESLQVHYGAVQALKGVSLHVNAGEVVTIKNPDDFRHLLARFRLAPEALPR